jgi:CSLREA domain-containing protein
MRSRVLFPALVACALFLSTAGAEALTFTVNSPADIPDVNPGDGVCETAPGNGVCTLRGAIQEANAHAGTDTIILQANVTYLLTRVGVDDTALNGDLDIKDNVTIVGAGATSTIIDGNANVVGERVFQIFPCVGGARPVTARTLLRW